MKRILFVDDHKDTLDIYQMQLRNEPYLCSFCEDGGQAVECFKAAKERGETFDLVVTDLVISPTETGVAIIRHIREIDKSCPIAVATGRKESNMAVMFHGLGVIAIWLKPIDMKTCLGDIFQMPEEVKRDRRNFFRRQFDTINQGRHEAMKFALLVIIILMQIRGLWMAPKIVESLSVVNRNVEALNGTPFSNSRAVIVPDTKDAYKVMADHRSRVTFEFGPEDEQFARELARVRGVRLKVGIE